MNVRFSIADGRRCASQYCAVKGNIRTRRLAMNALPTSRGQRTSHGISMGRTEACPVPEGKVAGTATDAVRQNSIAAAVGPMNQRTIYTPALPQFKYCVSDDIAFAFKNVDTSQCVGSVSVSQNLRYSTCVAFHRSPFRQRVSFQTRKQLRQQVGRLHCLG